MTSVLLTHEIEHITFPLPLSYFDPSIKLSRFSTAKTANPFSYPLSSPFKECFFPLSGPPKIRNVAEFPVITPFIFGAHI